MINKIKGILKNEDNNLNKYFLPFIILFLFIVLNTLIVINIYTKDKQKEDILRLHVVANSNSLEDQITKLKVASKVEDYISSINTSSNKNELIKQIQDNIPHILEISNNTLKENDKCYSTQINIGKISYEEKQNPITNMEQGVYDSMQVVLGNGNGKNIWSFIFPSEEDMDNIKNLDTIFPGIENLYYDTNTINEDEDKNKRTDEIQYDLKILEIFDNIKMRLIN